MKHTEPSIRDGRPPARVSQVTPQVERLLILLGGKGPLSGSEIRAAPGLRDRVYVRRSDIQAALAAGLIERAGGGEGKGRQYDLTPWGREVTRGILGRPPAGLPDGVWRKLALLTCPKSH